MFMKKNTIKTMPEQENYKKKKPPLTICNYNKTISFITTITVINKILNTKYNIIYQRSLNKLKSLIRKYLQNKIKNKIK